MLMKLLGGKQLEVYRRCLLMPGIGSVKILTGTGLSCPDYIQSVARHFL